MMLKGVCVFCGSGKGPERDVYRDAARLMGDALLQREIGLVYGGGRIGLMGTLADTVLAGGGRVIGVIPQSIVDLEVAHEGLSELHVVGSMHERKAMMADLADGFIALPGGFGTLEELCEVLTWAQLGLHQKPCGILNVSGYYDQLLGMFDHAVAEQFVPPVHRSLVLEETDPDILLDRMERYQAPPLFHWIEREET